MGLPVCLFLLRSVSSFLFLKSEFDGSYYPWTYPINRVARRTTCLYEIVSKTVLVMPSLRKADAKIWRVWELAKQNRNFFIKMSCFEMYAIIPAHNMQPL